jgi:hypothetical protein
MSSPPLTSENSAIVMIDRAVGFGNVFRSHDLSLHVNNTEFPYRSTCSPVSVRSKRDFAHQ